MKKYFFLIIKLIFFITYFSCVKNENNITNENNSIQISEVIINEPVDLSIKNILIFGQSGAPNVHIFVVFEVSSSLFHTQVFSFSSVGQYLSTFHPYIKSHQLRLICVRINTSDTQMLLFWQNWGFWVNKHKKKYS